MMTFGYSFNIWVPLLAFPTAGPYGAPRWQRGWPISLVFGFMLWAAFMAALVIHRRGYVSSHQLSDDRLADSFARDKKRQQAALSSSDLSGSDEAVSVEVDANEKDIE